MNKEELDYIVAQLKPTIVEHLKNNAKQVSDLELSATLDGVNSLPATVEIGGVKKIVQVPLTLLKAEVGGGEDDRVEAENKREVAENTRNSNETTREASEETRKASEVIRNDNETDRQNNEETRSTSENERIGEETKRKTSETARVKAEEDRVTEFDKLKEDSQTAITNAKEATDNVKDGKTPIFEIGTVEKGKEPSASVTTDGEDESGNPKLKLNVILPQGDDGKAPILECGTVTTVNNNIPASADIIPNGEQDGRPKYKINLAIPRGADGSLGAGDAKDLTVTFSEAITKENIGTGETISTIFGKIKKFFSSLAAVAFSGSYNDLSNKPTIPSIDGLAKTSDIPTTLPASDVSSWAKAATKPTYNYSEVGAAASSHTHSQYLTAHQDISGKLDKAYYEGINTVTTLASLPVTKRLVIANLSAATNISLKSALSIGKELHIVINASADISQPLPTTSGWSSLDGDTLSIASGKKAEISILCVAASTYVISSKAEE